ncbi:MAG: efflux RND transporter periplasmic adaptor subunit [Myxococcota bacterium]
MKRAFLAIGVLAVSVAGAVALILTRPEPQKERPELVAPLVEVITVEIGTHRTVLPAQGTTIPALEVDLQAEVGGRVVWQSPELVPGGHFAPGQAILAIDSRDLQLAVDQQLAHVDRAKLDLEVEHGRKVVAEKEWALLSRADGKRGQTGSGRSLALREPQLRTAKVALNAAESGLRQAKLNLSRTTLYAPFAVFVQSESVDVGQLLAPGMHLGKLIGSEKFWVQVSIPADLIGSVRVPKNGQPGSSARVWQEARGMRNERPGQVIQILSDVDPVGRMARLLVEIKDPLALQADGQSAPLLLGSYVYVDIEADELVDVIELPRKALRDGDTVWVVGSNHRLEFRPVRVDWRRDDTVLVGDGLLAGEQLVTSRLSFAVAGMRLRVAGLDDASEVAAHDGDTQP